MSSSRSDIPPSPQIGLGEAVVRGALAFVITGVSLYSVATLVLPLPFTTASQWSVGAVCALVGGLANGYWRHP